MTAGITPLGLGEHLRYIDVPGIDPKEARSKHSVMVMPSDDQTERDSEPLPCMRDDVWVSAEAPRCPHPSSSCPFRELCPVKDAIRRKNRGDYDR